MAGTKRKTPAKTLKRKDVKNPLIAKGVRQLSKAKVMRLTGGWKFIKDPVEAAKAAMNAPVTKTSPKMITKPIGGPKNGKERKVLAKKPRRFYATEDSLKPAKKSRKRVYRAARASITPGTVLILLTGRHRGRRVVYLKQLESGLLLVTGPYKLNSCPLRRIHQSFVIATSTKIDISSVKLPEIKEALFVKPKVPRSRGNTSKGGDLFEQKKADYTPSDERKKLQSDVDKQLLAAIAKSADGEILKNYLKKPFGLNSRMFPHALKF
ncbi:60S ribosomal protein L6 [Galendromus occidentalis]|uniref:60S ribosomal protein L6 n=1 Tax=Galendromus occidentalis TaxID=34638 RepID=A0AAJ6QW32_9ACAR|nr:60S ribosomal protein L6 [Galendromus occidentalis]